jgi:DUF4097 and DUF4098 domain-containing protein YvlB
VEEERLMILKMLEEGKITSEEAAALFEAMEEHTERVVVTIPPQAHVTTDDVDRDSENREQWDRGAREGVSGDTWDEFSQRMEDFGERVGQAAEELGERLSDKFSRLGEEMEQRSFGFSLGNWFFGSNYQFDDTITSESFGTQEGILEVELRGLNGNLSISSWDGSGLRAEIHKSVRGGSEGEAKERAKQLILTKIDPLHCSLVARDQNWASSSINLKVPKDRQYKLLIKTTNGNIHINDIEALAGDIATTNGKILIANLKGETLRFHSTNGRISGNLRANGCDAATVNGRIELDLNGVPGGIYRLKTTNGRITLGIPDSWPCMIDAKSNWGSIDLDLDNLTYHERNSAPSGGHKRIRASRPGQGQSSELELRTSNGSIKLLSLKQ